jgi:putative ABC transport system permease protein
MGPIRDDLKHALRGLRQNPGFAITAAAALALGIGANTAIFTVVKTVVLEPLPYPDSGRIVSVERPGGGSISEPIFGYIAQNNLGLEDLAAYHAGASMSVAAGAKPQLVRIVTASRAYFRLFGTRPIIGRVFTTAEDSPGGPPALLLSYNLWQSFGASPSILDRKVTLGGAAYTVIGVIAPGFQPYPAAEAWIPLQADPHSTDVAGILTVAGRLPAGSSLAGLNARLALLLQRYEQVYPDRLGIDQKTRATPLQERITGDVRPVLLILLGVVGLVLLIACANVANLLLARATVRRKEMAIRAALGAGRARIVRQLLTESLLLALTGGALGLLLGTWGVRALLAFTPGDLPRLQEIAANPPLDPAVALFTFSLAVSTGVLFGLAPAFHVSRAALTVSLHDSGARAGSGRRQNRIRGMLVAAETALAVLLVCGALLLLRSFVALHHVNLGFNPRHLLTIEISLAGSGYAQSSSVDRLAREAVERIERIPGVQSAALASALPLWGKMDMIFNIPGRIPPGRQSNGDVQWRFVSPHYFDVLGIPLLSGRLLRDEEAGRVAVISQAMARQFWPNQNPVGQSIFIGPGLGPAYQVGLTEIVGIVGDVRGRLYLDPSSVMYQLPSQVPDADMALLTRYESGGLLVRTRPGVAPMSVSQAVERAFPLPVAQVRTVDQLASDSIARQNFNSLLLATFAAIALLLAAAGIYGVMSYSVAQRTQEIGIRAALGAGRRDTVQLVLAQALRMSAAGIAAGLTAAFRLTSLLSAQLFGIQAADPLTFAVVPLILLAVALAAAGIPALRATRIDPLVALRRE